MKNGIELPIIPIGKPKGEEPSPKEGSAEAVLEKYEEAFVELAK